MPKPANRARPFNPLVVALAYDGLSAFEFSCAAEVFGLPRPELGPGWYRFETSAAKGRKVSGQYGISVRVDGGLDRLVAAGVIAMSVPLLLMVIGRRYMVAGLTFGVIREK